MNKKEGSVKKLVFLHSLVVGNRKKSFRIVKSSPSVAQGDNPKVCECTSSGEI